MCWCRVAETDFGSFFSTLLLLHGSMGRGLYNFIQSPLSQTPPFPTASPAPSSPTLEMPQISPALQATRCFRDRTNTLLLVLRNLVYMILGSNCHMHCHNIVQEESDNVRVMRSRDCTLYQYQTTNTVRLLELEMWCNFTLSSSFNW